MSNQQEINIFLQRIYAQALTRYDCFPVSFKILSKEVLILIIFTPKADNFSIIKNISYSLLYKLRSGWYVVTAFLLSLINLK